MKVARMTKPRRLLVVATTVTLFACNVEQPGAGDNYQSPQFKHTNLTDETCSSCHEEDRPAPFAEHPHGGDQDCTVCHTAKDDSSGWLPRKSFAHSPMPASCLDCHIKQRPAPPHAISGDCAGCHQYPQWK